MSMYESVLASSWELYYTSSAQRAASNIDHWLHFLTTSAKEANGVQQDQFIALLCRFYQLSGVAARDPLKGYVYQTTAETYSMMVDKDRQMQKKSINMLDQVGRIIRKGNLEDDGSFVKLNISGLYMDRARALTRFHEPEEAHDALDIARENLGPELTRWQARLLLADAQIYLAESDPESCCEMALEALKVVRATQSHSNKQRLENLCRQLHERYPHHPRVNRLRLQLQ